MALPKGKIRINVNDIIGKRLGKLIVIKYIGYYYKNTKGGEKVRHFYMCECDCGNINIVQRGPLKNEIVHSCGCIRRKNDGYKNEK